jgi:tetratricopeptide (TPR) repeat protein
MNLGFVLHDKGDLDNALTYLNKALTLDPKNATVWVVLGMTLQRQGRYAEACEATRRALALLPSGHPLRRTAAEQLRLDEQYLTLDGKLPAILRGAAAPANPREALTLAQMCQRQKKRYAAAARLFADAFTAEPKLAAEPDKHHPYDAACCALLAAAGQGEDAGLLPDKTAALFRGWALAWLRDELRAYAQLAGQNNPARKQAIQQQMAHWRRDSDLASVREPLALDLLSDNERAAWLELWHKVDALAERVAKKDEPPKGRKEREAPKTKPEGRSPSSVEETRR